MWQSRQARPGREDLPELVVWGLFWGATGEKDARGEGGDVEGVFLPHIVVQAGVKVWDRGGQEHK